jgi:hypothetical protein
MTELVNRPLFYSSHSVLAAIKFVTQLFKIIILAIYFNFIAFRDLLGLSQFKTEDF